MPVEDGPVGHPATAAADPMREVTPAIMDRGASWARWLLRIAGWRIRYQGTPPGCGVIIAYPHTSGWDFVVGILTVWAIGIPLNFLGKDSLFRVPVLGALMRRWGGIPVDRGTASGVIGSMADRLREANQRGERWWLALAPEGTRKREEGWRSGFYHIALAAQLPIGLAYFNFARREIGVIAFLVPSGDAEADMRQIERCYAGVAQGQHADQAAPVRFLR
jgi:1-acyl-sn-glycerol-3-phosphate acyltransferase